MINTIYQKEPAKTFADPFQFTAGRFASARCFFQYFENIK